MTDSPSSEGTDDLVTSALNTGRHILSLNHADSMTSSRGPVSAAEPAIATTALPISHSTGAGQAHLGEDVHGQHGAAGALLSSGQCKEQAGRVLLRLGGGCAQQGQRGRQHVAAQHEHVGLQAVCQAVQGIGCCLLAHRRLCLQVLNQVGDCSRPAPSHTTVSPLLHGWATTSALPGHMACSP